MIWDVVFASVIVFVIVILRAAVYSGTKMALQSFFGQQHVDLNTVGKARDGENRTRKRKRTTVDSRSSHRSTSVERYRISVEGCDLFS